MFGLGAYDSDDEADHQENRDSQGCKPKAAFPFDNRVSASTLPASVEGATGAKAKSLPKAPPVSARKIRELQADIASAKSATAVVQLARPALEDFWHAQWGADALLQIAKRSTARTRMEWVSDATVKKIAEKLEADIDVDYFDVMLIAMEALRRMKFQTPLSQSAMLQRALAVGGRFFLRITGVRHR